VADGPPELGPFVWLVVVAFGACEERSGWSGAGVPERPFAGTPGSFEAFEHDNDAAGLDVVGVCESVFHHAVLPRRTASLAWADLIGPVDGLRAPGVDSI
jgi:hypothetical protein